MENWNYKIKNDEQFQIELKRLTEKFNSQEKFPKGKEMIIERLEKLNDIVFNNKPIPGNKKSAGNLLPFLEFQGGEEFLETEDGKAIIEVFFYFAYKWEPAP